MRIGVIILLFNNHHLLYSKQKINISSIKLNFKLENTILFIYLLLSNYIKLFIFYNINYTNLLNFYILIILKAAMVLTPKLKNIYSMKCSYYVLTIEKKLFCNTLLTIQFNYCLANFLRMQITQLLRRLIQTITY